MSKFVGSVAAMGTSSGRGGQNRHRQAHELVPQRFRLCHRRLPAFRRSRRRRSAHPTEQPSIPRRCIFVHREASQQKCKWDVWRFFPFQRRISTLIFVILVQVSCETFLSAIRTRNERAKMRCQAFVLMKELLTAASQVNCAAHLVMSITSLLHKGPK